MEMEGNCVNILGWIKEPWCTLTCHGRGELATAKLTVIFFAFGARCLPKVAFSTSASWKTIFILFRHHSGVPPLIYYPMISLGFVRRLSYHPMIILAEGYSNHFTGFVSLSAVIAAYAALQLRPSVTSVKARLQLLKLAAI